MEAIAHYNILEPIGVDGVGEMFRARDTKIGRTVALKIVGPQLAGDAAALARLLEDAALASKLSHPNIAALWEYGCLLYTSPSPRDGLLSRMPSSA